MTLSEPSLARRGFLDPDAAQRRLDLLGGLPEELLDAVASVASPDVALASFCDILDHADRDALIDTLVRDQECRQRLFIVLGTSEGLGRIVARHPEFIDDLQAESLAPDQPNRADFDSAFEAAHDAVSLRVVYHRQLLSVTARDLTALADFEQTSAALADLAMATLAAALRIASATETQADRVRLSIIAMGKTGGRELNYVSDVDVVFVAEPRDDADAQASVIASRIASKTMRLCSEPTSEGLIWDVDANLRPEGKNGPLVRSLASHRAYYERWAETWEFQALLKARHAAGDEQLSQAYLDMVAPMVWEASTRQHFVTDVRAMRRRVIEHIAPAERERQLKLGPGGLRDVEFPVQLLQLVHGRVDENVRSATTVVALQQLIDGGYVGRRDGAAMLDAYEFLRTLEHRIQLFRLRRTHRVPDDEEDLRRLGRSMGYTTEPSTFLVKDWQAHRRVVMRLHEQLFYRPLLEAVAALPDEGLRLTTEAAEVRLRALGFTDPRGALKHIEALTSGVSRRASIQRSLLPAMLQWFAESPSPDAGLLAFRRISEGLGSTHWYLRKLRDESQGAEQLARVIASSRYVSDLIIRAPDSVALFGDESAAAVHDRERLVNEMQLAARRHDDPREAVRAIRRIRRRELSRVGIFDLLGQLDVTTVGTALSDLTDATLQSALDTAIRAVEEQRGAVGTRLSVVLMGRLGGREVGYGSDADVMFVHDPLPGVEPSAAAQAATAVVTELRRTLAAPADDPPLEVDADLRPEGRNGPLVRTLAAYRAYYDKWSAVWEAQALLRARPAVGDAVLNQQFADLIDPLRWPTEGLCEADLREIRRIKARVDAERLPRGANPNTHLKLGRGGLADIEWTVQLLQMQHAAQTPALRTTSTLDALRGAVQADLIAGEDADALEQAWTLVSRVRNAVVLLRARPAESLVEQSEERAGVAQILGYGADGAEVMLDDYLRTTRHARAVVDRVFWGQS